MSGLYIEGLKIQEETCLVFIHPDGSVTDYDHGKDFTAVPVPDHGRLIDADKLLQFHGVLDDGIYYPDAYIPATAIKTAPTIIPAEEGQ